MNRKIKEKFFFVVKIDTDKFNKINRKNIDFYLINFIRRIYLFNFFLVCFN